MTVKELIEMLEDVNPELEVLLSSDEEGNSFQAFSGDVSVGVGERDGYEYSFHSRENWEEEPEEYDGPYPGDNCIVLWP